MTLANVGSDKSEHGLAFQNGKPPSKLHRRACKENTKMIYAVGSAYKAYAHIEYNPEHSKTLAHVAYEGCAAAAAGRHQRLRIVARGTAAPVEDRPQKIHRQVELKVGGGRRMACCGTPQLL